MARLVVDVWSDIACPWCHVGKRRLEAALAGFEHCDDVEVRWRAFELNPDAPRVEEARPYAERLAAKYGTSLARGREMIRVMTETAAGDGLDFRFNRIRPGNTFDAHRLVHLAAERGLADAMKERLFLAYLSEGRAVGERETLLELAGEVGLDAREVAQVLDGDAHAHEVRRDEAEARALGVGGVPFFLVDGRLGLSGAQPAEVLLGVLRRAWDELRPGPAPAAGLACGPDGCD